MSRKKFSDYQKLLILNRQNFKCVLCGYAIYDLYEIDHVVPLSCNGEDAMDNLQALHTDCHSRKTNFETQLRHGKKELFCKFCNCRFSKHFVKNHYHYILEHVGPSDHHVHAERRAEGQYSANATENSARETSYAQ